MEYVIGLGEHTRTIAAKYRIELEVAEEAVTA
jgi:hypothetical protein